MIVFGGCTHARRVGVKLSASMHVTTVLTTVSLSLSLASIPGGSFPFILFPSLSTRNVGSVDDAVNTDAAALLFLHTHICCDVFQWLSCGRGTTAKIE